MSPGTTSHRSSDFEECEREFGTRLQGLDIAVSREVGPEVWRYPTVVATEPELGPEASPNIALRDSITVSNQLLATLRTLRDYGNTR